MSSEKHVSKDRVRVTDPPTHGLNIIPFACMAGGWLAPLIMFWLYVWGPLRPFSYPSGDLMPGLPFAVLVGACISVWWVMPSSYFRIRRFERGGKIYRLFGVLIFRRLVPDGDLANRWERKKNPGYKVIGDRLSAAAFVIRTEQSERGHLVLLALGIVSAALAWDLEWYGWATYLSAGNLVVNLYPIMLQRYTRGRLFTVLTRLSKVGLTLPGAVSRSAEARTRD